MQITQQTIDELLSSLAGVPLSPDTKESLLHAFNNLLNTSLEQHYKIFFKIKKYQKLGLCHLSKSLWQDGIKLLNLREIPQEQWNDQQLSLLAELIRNIRKYKKRRALLQQAILGHKASNLSNLLYVYDQKYKKEQDLKSFKEKIIKPFILQNGSPTGVSSFDFNDNLTNSYIIFAFNLVAKDFKPIILNWQVISHDFLIKQLAMLRQANHRFFVCRSTGTYQGQSVYQLVSEWETTLKINPQQRVNFRRTLSEHADVPYVERYKITVARFLSDKRATLILTRKSHDNTIQT